MSIKETDVKNISEALGEQAFFGAFRVQALLEAEHLPERTLKYGLGIFSSVPEEKRTWNRGAVEYENSVSGNVRVLSWEEAMKDGEACALLQKYFTPDNLPVLKNRHFAESLAAFGGGRVIVAEDSLESSVELVSSLEKDGADLVFIVAKKGSSLRVFETLTNKKEFFFGRTLFAVAEEGAQIDIVRVQELSSGSELFESRSSFVARGGKMNWYDVHSGGGFVKTDTEDFLREEGAESTSKNISLSANQSLDIYSVSHHIAPHTTSHLSARGIAGAGAKIVYRGLVDVPKGVRGAVGRQEGKFFIVSPGAEIDAIPALDVANNEVVSSHAVSITHLREEDLFFPALRGIPPYRAQAMMLSGFLTKGLENLLPKEYDAVGASVNRKLSSLLFRLD